MLHCFLLSSHRVIISMNFLHQMKFSLSIYLLMYACSTRSYLVVSDNCLSWLQFKQNLPLYGMFQKLSLISVHTHHTKLHSKRRHMIINLKSCWNCWLSLNKIIFCFVVFPHMLYTSLLNIFQQSSLAK